MNGKGRRRGKDHERNSVIQSKNEEKIASSTDASVNSFRSENCIFTCRLIFFLFAKCDSHLNMYRIESAFVWTVPLLLLLFLQIRCSQGSVHGVSAIARTSYNFPLFLLIIFRRVRFRCVCLLSVNSWTLRLFTGYSRLLLPLCLCRMFNTIDLSAWFLSSPPRLSSSSASLFLFFGNSTFQSGQAKHRTKVLIRNTLFASRCFFCLFVDIDDERRIERSNIWFLLFG